MEQPENIERSAKAGFAAAQGSASGYKSVTLLASEYPNLAEYLGQLERERDNMLAFIREQVELWDNAGDSGFPLYELGKQILARYPSPNAGDERPAESKREKQD
jgi:hypothetical protein